MLNLELTPHEVYMLIFALRNMTFTNLGEADKYGLLMASITEELMLYEGKEECPLMCPDGWAFYSGLMKNGPEEHE